MIILLRALLLLWLAAMVQLAVGSALLRARPGLGSVRGRSSWAFFACLWGGLAIGVLAAVICTHGRTVLVFAAIPCAVLAFGGRDPDHVACSLRSRLSGGMETLLLASLYFGVQIAPSLLVPSPLGMRIPHPDIVFFGFLGDSLLATGQENIYPNAGAYAPGAVGTTPYHYLEIWMAAGWAKVLGRTSVEAYVLLVLPLLVANLVLGLWAVAERCGRSGRLLRLALALAPFLPVPPLPSLPGRLLAGAPVLWSPPFPVVGKFLVIHVLLAAALLLAWSAAPRRALPVLTLLVPASALAAPAAGFTVGSVEAYLAVRSRRAGDFARRTGPLALVALGMVLFYLLTGTRQGSFGSLQAAVEQNATWGLLPTKVNVLGKTFLQIALLYSVPAILVLVLMRRFLPRGALKALPLVTLVFVAGGILGYAILSAHLLSVEFASVPAPAAIWVTTAVAGIIQPPSPTKRATSAVLAALGMAGLLLHLRDAARGGGPVPPAYTDRPSADYLIAVKALAPRCERGGYVVGEADVGDPWDITRPLPTLVPETYTLGAYLSLMRGCSPPTFLGSFDIRHSNQPFLRETPLWRYSNGRGVAGPGGADNVERFLRERRLQYVIAAPAATLPPSVLEHAARVITDSSTGERFVVLKDWR